MVKGKSAIMEAEETFLLVKPDASQHHAAILQAIADSGLQVTMQSFTVTQEHAETIVAMYQSVIAAAEVSKFLRGGGGVQSAISHETSRTSDSGLQTPMEVESHEESSFDATTGNSVHSSGGGGIGGGSGFSRRRRHPNDAHNNITNEIMKIARRGADPEGRGGVNAGLPAEDDNRGTANPSGAAATSGSRRRKTDGRSSSGRDGRDLAREHIQHLVRGTCLAVAVSGPNAISAMMLLAGPEDPEDAKQSAPRSLRAKYGTDLVKNAVFVTTNTIDANTLVKFVFGYESRNSELKKHNLVAGAVATLQKPPIEILQFDDVGDMIADDLGILDVLDGGGGGGPGGNIFDTFLSDSAGLPATLAKRNYNAHASPALGGGVLDANDVEGAPGGGIASTVGGSPFILGGGGGGSSEIARMLADERKKLRLQSKALRLREMDLMMREQELFRIASGGHFGGTSTPQEKLHPFPATQRTHEPANIDVPLLKGPRPPGVSRDSAAGPPIGGGHRSTAAFDPLPPAVAFNSLRSKYQNVSAAPPGPCIAEDDIDSLIANPRRVGYLFNRLDTKREGVITREDFLHLYMRSPCLHMIGLDNHVVALAVKLERTTPATMNVEEFAVALMALLRS